MNRTARLLSLLAAFALILAACNGSAPANNTANTKVPAEEEAAPAAEESTAEEPAAEEAPAEEEMSGHEWPAPAPAEEDFSRREPTAEEAATRDALANQVYAYWDYLLEAFTHSKVDFIADPVVATDYEQPAIGSTREFWIDNNDLNTTSLVTMKLLAISEHAYFYFDVDREAPSDEDLENAKVNFERVYERNREVFGEENVPGVDGDPHIFILHPRGDKLCNVSGDQIFNCGIAGYFFGIHQYPISVMEHSNVMEGLIMNFDLRGKIGSDYWTEVVAHELRHLIEYWYDQQGETWEVEGSAVMAEELNGFASANLDFANFFMEDPDLQLNSWKRGQASLSHYGQGYVINRYIYDRFGEEFYSQWVQDPDGGLNGLTKILVANGYELTGEQVWLDWLVALAIHDNELAAPEYRFAREFRLDEIGNTLVSGLPRTVEEEVHQYAADMYRIKSTGDVTVSFTGTTLVSTLDILPVSGNYYWYTGRADGALPELVLSVDLTGVESATLEYDTYFNFYKGYYFGYVMISTNGGETWTALETENMVGDAVNDDPAGQAFTPKFYTGTSTGGNWLHESIDLSAFTGQQVQIRWDAELGTQVQGFALDNIAIPEIDFYDDVESANDAWTTDGWNRVTAYMPQTFHLLLITFDEAGAPTVSKVPVNADNTASFDITGYSENNDTAWLIVAATAPDTLDTAPYTFTAAPK